MAVFSIVVPVYGVEAYLDRCVSSLMEQSFGDIEIVLVDDGGFDTCPQMCDDYARRDSRIRVLHKLNGGVSDARNKGLEAASGVYVLFVDGDDYIDRDACERLLPFTKGNADMLLGGAVAEAGGRVLEPLAFAGTLGGQAYYKQALKAGKNWPEVWLNGYRRGFLEERGLRFQKGILHEDEAFTPRAFLAAKSVVYTGETFYRYVLREGSITNGKDKGKNLSDYEAVCRDLEPLYEKIEDRELKNLLKDELVCGYLSLFQEAKGHIYGKAYIHKGFCLKNAKRGKTRLKSLLFALSPRLYWQINKAQKRLRTTGRKHG